MSKNRDLGNYGSAALLNADTIPTGDTVVKRTAEGKVKTADAADTDDAVAFGQLGTAALRDVMTSLTDVTTENALMPRGAFGLGAIVSGEITNADTLSASGFYSVGSEWVGSPFVGVVGTNQGYLHHYSWTLDLYAIQFFYTVYSGATPMMKWRRKGNGEWSAWVDVYNSGNILGTVSQIGGIPTGAIIERGSNSNGDYVKFADGTLECYGGLTSNGGGQIWTFPSVFVAGNVNITGNVVGNNAFNCLVAFSPPGVSSVPVGLLDAHLNSFAAGGVIFGLRAIGRWY